MEYLKINVVIQGSEIAFTYRQDHISRVWLGVLTDECNTVEERLLATSAEECLDGIIPFLEQLGNIVSVTADGDESTAVYSLRRKLKLAG